jgi:hypothetical protein
MQYAILQYSSTHALYYYVMLDKDHVLVSLLWGKKNYEGCDGSESSLFLTIPDETAL